MFHEKSILESGKGFLVEKRGKRILERADFGEKTKIAGFLACGL